MRRALSLLLSIFILSTMATASEAATINYATDVKKHWSQEYVWFLQRNNLVQGYPDNTFRPDQPVTRAEFTKMFISVATNQYCKAYQIKTPANDINITDFKDVDQIPLWAKQYIEYAVKYGYITGFSDGTFGSEKLITKAQAVTIMGRTLNMEYDITKLQYKDTIPQWALIGVTKAYQYGIVETKKDGLFNSDTIMTRADIAKFLYIYYVGKDIEDEVVDEDI